MECFVIHGGPLGSHLIVYAEMTHMGTAHARKTKHVIRGLNHMISARSLGKREWLEIEFNDIGNHSINYAYIIKPQ